MMTDFSFFGELSL